MRRLRAFVRGLVFTVLCTVFYTLWLVGFPLAALSGRREPWRAWIFHTWAKRATGVLGVTTRVQGEPPRAPFLLVSNHLSYLDIILLASQARCVFVSKAEVARWPIIGLLARSMGTLFLDRTKKRDVARIADQIRERFELGQGVVFFPEGTSTPGAEVIPFRSSLLEPAATAGLPVRHVTLRYATPASEPPAHMAVSWWGDMEFAPHFVELLGLARIEASVVFGEEPIREPDRKLLAEELHRRVAASFTPMTEARNVCLSTGI